MRTSLAAALLATLTLLPSTGVAGPAVALGSETEPNNNKRSDDEKRSDAGELADGGMVSKPTEASGIEVGPSEPSKLRWVGRAALFVPRLAVEVINAPIRGTLYAVDRYQLVERTEDVFFDDTRTYGVYPTGFFRAGFGFSGGVKGVHRDLFGHGESISAKALYGGRFDQDYKLKIGSGELLSKYVEIDALGQIELQPKERFFGIGNADLVSAESVTGLVDPTVDDTAVATRYREARYDAGIDVDFNLGDSGFYIGAMSRLERREFERSTETELAGDAALADVYDPAAVNGFMETLDSSYTELELRFDTRRPDNHYASAAMPSDGWLIAARAGHNRGIGGGPDRGYMRYTGDVQKYFDLYEGTRVLGFRLLASQIDADLGDIPFVYLPKLGGDGLLRGYETDRFHDRGLTMATAEYKWEIAPKYLAAYAFTDVGRVQRSVLDPELDNLRVGFGAGLQVHTLSSFLMRAHVASSIDGGLFLNIDFDPVMDARIRE